MSNDSPNKYLEKIAGKGFNKALGYFDSLIGHSHGKLKQEAEILASAEARGRKAKHALLDAAKANKRMVSARVKTGVGVAALGTAGFIGLHKYHQHKDNAIMAKINEMYVDPNQSKGN